MRRIILAAALLLVAQFAHAIASAPVCYPSSIGGAGSKLVSAQDAVGFAVGWVCPQDSTGKSQMLLFYGHWTDLPGAYQKTLADALNGGKAGLDPVVAAIPECPKNAAGGCAFPSDLAGVVPPVWQGLIALLPPAPPPAPAFWVKQNALAKDGSQGIYNVVINAAGAPDLGTPTGARAGPHSPCDPSVTIMRLGGLTYMAVPGTGGAVAVLCEKAQ